MEITIASPNGAVEMTLRPTKDGTGVHVDIGSDGEGLQAFILVDPMELLVAADAIVTATRLNRNKLRE